MDIKTHYLGLVENGEVKRLEQLQTPVDAMQVRLVQVIKPGMQDNRYDYSVYAGNLSNFLIPLEVIYRNALPAGSSVFKRLQDGSLTISDIGLSEIPVHGQRLEKPILDVSTKLEAIDRYLNWDEAIHISGIGKNDIELVKNTTLRINQIITQEADKMGLVQEDGKIEFGMDRDSKLMLVDVLGTPDECRFTFEGIPVSKEAARIYYRKTPWYKEVEATKKEDSVRWKEIIGSPPPPLPEELDTLISQLYMAFCNELTSMSWFQTPPLSEILFEMRDVLNLEEK